MAAFGPGRVNLVGEHTDYNDGLALSFPISLGVTVHAEATDGAEIQALASDIGERDVFPVDRPRNAPGWRAFVRGSVAELTAAGHQVPGARLRFSGTVPQGSGLSSSAALEVGLCLALLGLIEEPCPDRMDLARLCSRVENQWVGAQTGLLDQITALFGNSGEALRIDFRTLERESVPLHIDEWTLATVDSGEPRSLSTSGYNQRRDECRLACEIVGIPSLRDMTPDDLSRLPAPLDERARHIIEENARVDAAVAALRSHDMCSLALVISASHRSVRDLYGASTAAVEATVSRVLRSGAAGARMMGGGFGGHVLALFPPGCELPVDARRVSPGPGGHVIAT